MTDFYKNSIKTALRGIGFPVAHLTYKGKDDTYITYYSYRKKDIEFADNQPIVEQCSCTVEIFVKTENQTLVSDVKKRLSAEGWYVSDEDEDYDEDRDLYVTRIDIEYIEVIADVV